MEEAGGGSYMLGQQGRINALKLGLELDRGESVEFQKRSLVLSSILTFILNPQVQAAQD